MAWCLGGGGVPGPAGGRRKAGLALLATCPPLTSAVDGLRPGDGMSSH